MDIMTILTYLLLVLAAVFLVMLRTRRNIFLAAGTVLLATSFALFMIYFKYAGPESFEMLWIILASPIIFIISLILIIVGMIEK